MYYSWKPYVSVTERRRQAAREIARRIKKGQKLSPVVVSGKAISGTFWGKAWCDNMQRYSDFSNRLPRGRSYVRNGAVIDLKITAGEVRALVRGSMLYEVEVKVAAVPKTHWRALCKDCAGGIDSLVELLQGRFSQGVMTRICKQGTGLFPAPREIKFNCTCPDWASLCKHVAAVFYGIGARLDERPELLFTLRKVDQHDLIASSSGELPLGGRTLAAGRRLVDTRLDEVFGIDLAQSAVPDAKPAAQRQRSEGGTRTAMHTRIRGKKVPQRKRKATARPSKPGR